MVTKVFSGDRLVILSAAVVFLTAELAHAAPPPIRLPVPPPGGPHIGRPLPPPGVAPSGDPFLHPGHHVPPPYYHPHNGGYGGYSLYSGFYYVPYYSGYGTYYPYYQYSYAPSDSNYGAALNTPAMPAPTAEEKELGALLAASGVPTEEGRPAWPLALRVLPGKEAQALRGQIDALLQAAATQTAHGRPNTAVVEELGQATDHLRKLLLRHRDERGGMAQHTYEEARRFLDKLAGAQKLLRNS